LRRPFSATCTSVCHRRPIGDQESLALASSAAPMPAIEACETPGQPLLLYGGRGMRSEQGQARRTDSGCDDDTDGPERDTQNSRAAAKSNLTHGNTVSRCAVVCAGWQRRPVYLKRTTCRSVRRPANELLMSAIFFIVLKRRDNRRCRQASTYPARRPQERAAARRQNRN